MARYAIEIARCVLPRPVLPKRMSEFPSVTKSGERHEPRSSRRTVELEGEVEFVDRLEEREMSPRRETFEASSLSMRDLFRDEASEERVVRPSLLLGDLYEVTPDTPGICKMQAFEHLIHGDVGRLQDAPPCRRSRFASGSLS